MKCSLTSDQVKEICETWVNERTLVSAEMYYSVSLEMIDVVQDLNELCNTELDVIISGDFNRANTD